MQLKILDKSSKDQQQIDSKKFEGHEGPVVKHILVNLESGISVRIPQVFEGIRRYPNVPTGPTGTHNPKALEPNLRLPLFDDLQSPVYHLKNFEAKTEAEKFF